MVSALSTSASRADHKSASLPSALVTRSNRPKRNRPESSASFRRCFSSGQWRRNDQTSASAGQSLRRRQTQANAASSAASETRAAVRRGERPRSTKYPTTSAARIAVGRRSIRSSRKPPLPARRTPRKPAIGISLILPRPAETDQRAAGGRAGVSEWPLPG
jgi:hypothetical protein